MSPRRRRFVVGGAAVVVLLALATLLLARQPTPTSAETSTAVMSLGVVGGPTSGDINTTTFGSGYSAATADTTHCNGATPTTCTFPVGTGFNVAAYVNTPPAGGVYNGVNFDIKWTATSGSPLRYRAFNGELVWIERNHQANPAQGGIEVGPNRLGSPTNEIQDGAATNTSLANTSLTGLAYIIHMVCPATASQSNVQLLTDPNAAGGGSGFGIGLDVVAAKAASLTINCELAPTEAAPTEAPAATATPGFPTTGSGAAGGGSNGGLWMIIGVLAAAGAVAGFGIAGWRQVGSRP